MADEENQVPDINVENVRQARESAEHVGHVPRPDDQDADDVPDIPTKNQPEAEPPIDRPRAATRGPPIWR